MPFLDGNVEAGTHFPINRRERDGNVKGNAVAFGEDGFRIGADFVGDITGAAEGAVAANDDEIDLAALHQMAGGVVGDNLMRNFLLGQLPGGERTALATRAGFVAIDVKFFALALSSVHGGGGAADVHKSKPARIAMRQHVHAVANQFSAVLADFGAVARVFVGELLGGGQRQRLLLFDALAGLHDRANLVHCVDGVHGGGPRGFQGFVNSFDMLTEFRQ